MTISANVRKELFEMTSTEGKLIRIKPTEAKAGTTVYSSKQAQPLKMWTQEEHERFLEAMEKYPAGPWKVIASFIGSKTTRQTMTHAQKYRQKISRWRRGLRHKGRKQQHVDVASIASASSSSDEAEVSANETLFKAIDYVSHDDRSSTDSFSSPVRSLSSIRFDGRSEREANGGEGRSELFKLAELASIEVMKHEPPRSPVLCLDAARRIELKQLQSQQQQQYVDYEMQQPVDEPPTTTSSYTTTTKALKLEKIAYRPSKEWCTRKTEIKLSPLRGIDTNNNRSTVASLSYMSMNMNMNMNMNVQHRNDLRSLAVAAGGGIRLPPLNMAARTGHVFAIPPLRTKIDPSVFARAQFAATH